MAAAEKRMIGNAIALPFPLLWPTLLQMVHRRFYWLDHARIEDAVAEAVLRRLEKDSDFLRDAEKGIGESVLRSLHRAACRSVGDGLRIERRRCARERHYAHRKKNDFPEDFFVPNGLSAANIGTEKMKIQWERLLAGCRAWERAFVALRKQGCRELMAYVEVLGMEQCILAEQRRAVNRAWNGLRKKLCRRAKRLSQGGSGCEIFSR